MSTVTVTRTTTTTQPEPKYKYSFTSGTVEGTLEQLVKVACALGETLDMSKLPRMTGTYWSESKQTYLRIGDMNDIHIRNALCKRGSTYLQTLDRKGTSVTNKEFLAAFCKLADDPVVSDLFTELAYRQS